MADLRDSGSQPLPEVTAAPPLPLPLPLPLAKQQQQAGAPAGPAGGISIEAAAGSSSGGWGGQSAGTAATAAQQQQQLVTSSGLAGGLAYLQQSMPTLGSMGLPLSSALSSLRGRLGLPATSSLAGLAVQQQAASISEEHDEGLLQLGERALAGAGSSSSTGAATAGPPNTLQLIAAARQFLATSSAGQLRLADLPVLMSDYRRLARLGWSMLLRCTPAACLPAALSAACCCCCLLPDCIASR
jgi:hypothetical protein